MSRKIVRQNSTSLAPLLIFFKKVNIIFIFTYNKIVKLIIVEAKKIKLKYILAYIWSILCVGKLYSFKPMWLQYM